MGVFPTHVGQRHAAGNERRAADAQYNTATTEEGLLGGALHRRKLHNGEGRGLRWCAEVGLVRAARRRFAPVGDLLPRGGAAERATVIITPNGELL